MAHDKEAWLGGYADDAIVEDPIGPSHFDPDGKGHRGRGDREVLAYWEVDRATASARKM